MSELGTVEQQLDVLQQKKGPPNGIDQPDQLDTDIQTTNDVTFDDRFSVPGNSSLRVPSSSSVPGVVFPSVKNKPSGEAGALDGADALLTGVRHIAFTNFLSYVLFLGFKLYKIIYCIK